MKKKIFLVFILIGVVGVIAFSFINTKEKLDIKDIDANRLAVFVKQSDGTYKTETQIPQIGYTLNVDKSTCSNGAKPTWSNNTLSLSNLTSNNTNCYLYFDDDTATKKLKELGLTANTGTPDFSQVATTDEGIYATEDGMYGGTSYYWRGAATTNYVKFAGFCWRAIRINGDGSIRLIYDGSTCHQNGESTTDSIAIADVKYNVSSNQSNYVGWTYEGVLQRPSNNETATPSNAKIQLENWFNTNITGDNSRKLVSGNYCNDREVGEPLSNLSGYVTIWSVNGTEGFVYAGAKRLKELYTPTLSCNLKDIYILNVGLITADEIVYVGGISANNTSYYLYNGQDYWTMSPFRWSNPNFQMFLLYSSGYLGNATSAAIGLRPVINLSSDVTLTGNGTIDKPFIVEGAE